MTEPDPPVEPAGDPPLTRPLPGSPSAAGAAAVGPPGTPPGPSAAGPAGPFAVGPAGPFAAASGAAAPSEGAGAAGPGVGRSAAVSLAVVAGTAVLGVAAGLVWAAVAPRAALVMVSPGTAGLVHVETRAFIVADVWFALIMVAGGVISGAAGYLLAVRRHGPLAMAGVLAGAAAAALLARWVGEQPSRSTFNHLLASLPDGAHLLDVLSLGATGALAFWPIAAGLVAGGLEFFRTRQRPPPTTEVAGTGESPSGRPGADAGRMPADGS